MWGGGREGVGTTEFTIIIPNPGCFSDSQTSDAAEKERALLGAHETNAL